MRIKENIIHIVRSWRRHWSLQMATLLVLVGVFSTLSISALCLKNLNRILARWGESIQITVYLKDNISSGDTDHLSKLLKENTKFKEIKYVSKTEALEQFKKNLQSYAPHFMSDPGFKNPLPASFTASLDQHMASKNDLDLIMAFSEQLKKLAGVEDVSYGQGWVENFAGFVSGFSLFGAILSTVLLGGAILVIANSVQSSINQRREQIEILELVGATAKYIRRPFLFEGAVMGFCSGVVALLITMAFYIWLQYLFGKALQVWSLDNVFTFFNMSQVLLFFAFTTALGVVGSWFTVKQINSGWAAAQRQV